jgi:mRNA interferase MazF
MKRGEIWQAQLFPRSGSEQRGNRPVLIISHDAFNQAPGWRSIIVIPISTSKAQAGRGPTAVFFPSGSGGLKKDSVALCHQVTTLDRAKLAEHLGTLSPHLLSQVENGLKAAVDVP